MINQDISKHLPQELSESSAFFYTALSVFMSRNSNAVIPEILYFMNPDQVITFINTFGGTTVKVPTIKEFGEDLMTSLVVFFREQKGMSDEEIRTRLDLPQVRWDSISRKIDVWKKFVADEIHMDKELVK